jgi:hypothetical protein
MPSAAEAELGLRGCGLGGVPAQVKRNATSDFEVARPTYDPCWRRAVRRQPSQPHAYTPRESASGNTFAMPARALLRLWEPQVERARQFHRQRSGGP